MSGVELIARDNLNLMLIVAQTKQPTTSNRLRMDGQRRLRLDLPGLSNGSRAIDGSPTRNLADEQRAARHRHLVGRTSESLLHRSRSDSTRGSPPIKLSRLAPTACGGTYQDRKAIWADLTIQFNQSFCPLPPGQLGPRSLIKAAHVVGSVNMSIDGASFPSQSHSVLLLCCHPPLQFLISCPAIGCYAMLGIPSHVD